MTSSFRMVKYSKVKKESDGWGINEKKLLAGVEDALANNVQNLNGKTISMVKVLVPMELVMV